MQRVAARRGAHRRARVNPRSHRSRLHDGPDGAVASPLAGAAWLASVDLGGNRIADATPLAATHPENLRLAHNRITDVGQFLAFDRLTYVDLTGNPVPCETEAAELALLRQRVAVFGACD